MLGKKCTDHFDHGFVTCTSCTSNSLFTGAISADKIRRTMLCRPPCLFRNAEEGGSSAPLLPPERAKETHHTPTRGGSRRVPSAG